MMPEIQPVLLKQLGWDSFFEDRFRELTFPDAIPGRVASVHRNSCLVYTEDALLQAHVSGRLRYEAGEKGRFPAVGDWTVVSRLPDAGKGIIHAILPRRSQFSRQAAGGRTEEQVVAANMDTVFIVGALDGGRSVNLRRVERYLTLAWSSGATPVILLNKADLCHDVDASVRSVDQVAMGVPIHPVSATQRVGLDSLKRYLGPGSTAGFLGSSGVGKSALINALLGEARQQVGEIRERDHTGRHTTSSRELILIHGGGTVIDTPGMREIQMWAGEDDVGGTFDDIEVLAGQCRFGDCQHGTEPGCAVRAAIERGDIDGARFDNYRKLQKEIHYHQARQAGSLRLDEKTRWKKISQWQKSLRKSR